MIPLLILGTRVYFQIPTADDVSTYQELQPLIQNSGPDWIHTFRPMRVMKILALHGINVVNPKTNTHISYKELDSVAKVFLLQIELTIDGLGAENRLASAAFDGLYRQYGLEGLEALFESGYDVPTKVADFWMECHQSVGELAQRLNLK